VLLELRWSRPYWGPRRLVFELGKRGVVLIPNGVCPAFLANAEKPIRVVGPVAERTRVAYQADRKPLPLRSGIWLPGDYGVAS
jgi:hypothetical protein